MTTVGETRRRHRRRPAGPRLGGYAVASLRVAALLVATMVGAVLVVLADPARLLTARGLGLLAAAALPAAFIWYWIALDDRVTASLWTQGSVAVTAAVLVAIPAAINPLAGAVVGTATLLPAVLYYAGVVAVLEEVLKLVALAGRGGGSASPSTGAALGGAAGLGFAVAENVFALTATTVVGGDPSATAMTRVPASSAHVAFGAVGGYLLLAVDGGALRRGAVALAAAVGLHGGYDVLLWIVQDAGGLALPGRVAMLLFMGGLALVLYGTVTERGPVAERSAGGPAPRVALTDGGPDDRPSSR